MEYEGEYQGNWTISNLVVHSVGSNVTVTVNGQIYEGRIVQGVNGEMLEISLADQPYETGNDRIAGEDLPDEDF